MNESEQYHWESETFRNKYEAFLYYMRAVLNKIKKEPLCSKEISDKCDTNIALINGLLFDYIKWYNMGYGNWGRQLEFKQKDESLKKLLARLNDIDIFEH